MTIEALPDAGVLAAYLAACWVLQGIPGPDMMLVIGKGVSVGRKEALKVVLGVFLGVLIQGPVLALGTLSLLSAYEHALDMLRALGAAYLAYLAFRSLRTVLRDPAIDVSDWSRDHSNPVVEGFLSNVSNPKVFVFLFAFIPQFVDPSKGQMGDQLLVLLLIMKVNGLLVNGSVAILSGTASGWLAQRQSSINWGSLVAGLVYLSISLSFGYAIIAD